MRNHCGLTLGWNHPLAVREELLKREGATCRLAFVSDIHLRRGRSDMLASQVIDALERSQPDVILLGGDLLDHASELAKLEQLLKRMTELAPVFAVPGNHDVAVGTDRVRAVAENAGVTWIENTCVEFRHGGRVFAFCGTGASSVAAADVRVLCAHHPRVWRKAVRGGFDLVLAGHLHGCQVVCCEVGGLLFPGALFYPHNYLRKIRGASKLVVSRGCNDLIPIRWNCPREIVLCIL